MVNQLSEKILWILLVNYFICNIVIWYIHVDFIPIKNIIIIAGLKQLSNLKQVAITTNGLTLTRQLPFLQKAGLDAINISLDTLQENRFEQFTRRKGWSRVMAAIDLAIQLGYNPVKVWTN